MKKNEAISILVTSVRPREPKDKARYEKAVKMAVDALKEPERKKEKWKDYSDEGFVECPFCHSATHCDGNKGDLHFCFSCGAELEG